MALRTQEEIIQYLQLDKEKRLKKQQLEKDRQNKIKAQERLRKQQHKQYQAQLKKQALEALKKPQIISRFIQIYNTTQWIDRAPAEDELYLTREELKEAESRGEGKIRWNVWNTLVDNTREMLKKKK